MIVGELRWLVKSHRPCLLFLSEIKMKDSRVQSFVWSLGYSGCFAVSSEGQSGGLGLFWISSMLVDIKGFNSRCIDALVTPEDGQTWRISFVYGEPRWD
jgi:hypothetical protein